MPSDAVQMITTRGTLCRIEDVLGRALCHLHDPDRYYAQQRPRHREKLLTYDTVQMTIADTALDHHSRKEH